MKFELLDLDKIPVGDSFSLVVKIEVPVFIAIFSEIASYLSYPRICLWLHYVFIDVNCVVNC